MIFKLNFHLKFSLTLIFFCFYFFSNCPAFTEKKETIKSGFYENKPKLFMHNEKYSGIFIDILEEIGKKNNFKIEYTKCEWPECIELLKKGEIDIMPDVAFSLERSRQFNFNNEIVFESFSQIYTKKGIKIERLSDLDGLTIALLEGSIQEKIIVTMMSGFDYRLKVLHVNSYEEAFNLTAQGIVDAAVANHFFGEYFYKWYNLSKTPLVFNPAALHFAAPKNKNTELLEKIDRTLKIMKANPGSVYYKALEKWMERPPVTAVPQYIYFILFLLLIFFLSSLGIIILLKTKINKKKLNLQIFKNEFEKSEKKFKNLFETMGLAVVFQNKDQEIILANKEAEYLLGFSFKSVGKKKFNLCKNAVTEDGLAITKINNPFFKASEKGEKTCGLIAGIKTYGNSSLKWVLINSTPEIDPESPPPIRGTQYN
ncbi:MAG: transporter substrate-binding domain-containing protein [Desulforegulaceae bacterium]|nr:transporter substrate-binding domain-containing protein [Desulforegulaceae bacterium]